SVDAVLVTSPPHSSQLAGWLIARATGVPWVADFRDRWCAGEFQAEPTHLHRALDCALERWVVRRAAGVVAVTHGLARRLGGERGHDAVTTIYNGFDADEFDRERREANQLRQASSRLTITFVGAITEVSWPGALLQAVRRLPASTRRDLLVRFYGLDLTGKLQSFVAELDLEEVVEMRGYVQHGDAVRALLAGDVLYLPVSARVHPGYVPGKLFEYIGSLRPVLASVPEGETAALLRHTGAAWLCPPGDVDCLAAKLKDLYRLWRRRQLPTGDPDSAAPFDRRRQTSQLAAFLNRVISSSDRS
ncbi:MAG TPA: glycosyltransferase, partial [Bacteroidetes bacterium]|nr:glycosyltransferase [Bacteroidota bacterium]